MNQLYSLEFQTLANNSIGYIIAMLITGYLIYYVVNFSYKYSLSVTQKKYDLLQKIKDIHQSRDACDCRIKISNYIQPVEIAYVLVIVINRVIKRNLIEQLYGKDKIWYNILLLSSKSVSLKGSIITLFKGGKPVHREDCIYNCYELNANESKIKHPVATNKMKVDLTHNFVNPSFKKRGSLCYNLNTFSAYINAKNRIMCVDLFVATVT